MFKTAKKLVSLGVKAARITQKEIAKEVNEMAKSGVISRKEAKELVSRITAEANLERQRLQNFVRQEVKKEMKKAKPLIAEAKQRARKAAMRAKPKLRRIAKKAMAEARKGAKKAVSKAARKARKTARKAASRAKPKRSRKGRR